MTEQQDRQAILKKVVEYYKNHKKQNENFTPGDRIAYAGRVYDESELVELINSSLEFWLTAGPYTEQFEKKLAAYLGVSFCSLVNSGSSANLLAFMVLTSPLLGERAVKRGDEVITVAAGFPTTIAPMIQYGAIPVFVDITIPQYNVDCDQLQKALSPKTKAVMLAHTLGNPFDLRRVRDFCDQNGLWLIEDNCDSLGSSCAFNGEMKFTGTVGDMGTSSFYPPHHMTMGEGGAVYTSDPLLSKIVRSMRDWGRDCTCPSGCDNLCGHRFDGQFGSLPKGYDHKYVYSHFGYNLKATDMQAAIGCAQLEKLPDFTERRKANWAYLQEGMKDLDQWLTLPEKLPGSDPSWFGFFITCKEGINRNALVQHLESKNIQTRMLFGGNMTKHPCFENLQMDKDYRIVGDLQQTDRVMQDGFWIGVYPGMMETMLNYMVEMITDGVKRIKP